MYEFEEVEQCWSIAKILESQVPPEDELGVTILKFSLVKQTGGKNEVKDGK